MFTMLPTKTLPKIIQEKLWIQNPRCNGYLTLFDALIVAHVICPNAELVVVSSYWEFNLKKI